MSFGNSGSYKCSSEGSFSSSSDSRSQDEHYSSGIPGFPLKDLQEM